MADRTYTEAEALALVAAALEGAAKVADRHLSKVAVNEPLWHEGRDWAAESIALAIRALIPAAAALAEVRRVKVKPLVWEHIPSCAETGLAPHSQAEGFGGHYLIEHWRGSGGLEFDLWHPMQVEGTRFCAEADAKSAAQADYEARILAALEGRT